MTEKPEIREINTGLVVLVGDTHGEYAALFRKIDHLKIRNSLLVSVGDNGLGFPGYNENYVLKINKEFKKRGIECLMIRGNHDRPDMFLGQNIHSNFKLIPDYTVMKINGETWQFVGGAISVDRKSLEYNGTPTRIEGKSYWSDEPFVLHEKKAVECDVLITHTSPTWIGPNEKGAFVRSFYERDPHLRDELIKERKQMNELFNICRPKKAFFGHFHTSETVHYSNQKYCCLGRILDILEMVEYTKI
jgi:hypothetical protein